MIERYNKSMNPGYSKRDVLLIFQRETCRFNADSFNGTMERESLNTFTGTIVLFICGYEQYGRINKEHLKFGTEVFQLKTEKSGRQTVSANDNDNTKIQNDVASLIQSRK